MDMESKKILFALSTPMGIRNECCLPSHSSPKMYLGTRFFDLSSSWGIDDRDDLLRTRSPNDSVPVMPRGWQGFITAGFVILHVNGVTILLN